MTYTALGIPGYLKSLSIPPVAAHPEQSTISDGISSKQLEEHKVFIAEDTEIPRMGCISATQDVFRFAEILRRGGDLDECVFHSQQLLNLQPQFILDRWLINMTHLLQKSVCVILIQRITALALSLRQRDYSWQNGELCNIIYIRQLGMGSMAFRVDPKRDLTFLFLSACELGDYENILRL